MENNNLNLKRQIKKVRFTNAILTLSFISILALTALIELVSRKNYEKLNFDKLVGDLHKERLKIRRQFDREQQQKEIEKQKWKYYTDPLKQGSKGKFVWLNDLQVYVAPNGRVYTITQKE